jgi:hypothetical protein
MSSARISEAGRGTRLQSAARERILEWMAQQDFSICPDPEDQGPCNVYKNLNFPPEVYEKISSFYEQGEAGAT